MTETYNASHQKLARRLIVLFLAWKCILFLLVVLSPGSGYDTSGLILLQSDRRRYSDSNQSSLFDRFTLNLFRWDALYFVTAAQRGYVYEHEWAFSRANSLVWETVAQYLYGGESFSLQHYIWAGIAVSNICHLLSVLVLFSLLNVVLGSQQNGRIAFIASVLHIMSPAGLFLSAPYAEALFAAINFTGMLHYARARSAIDMGKKHTIREDAFLLSSGLLFAIATWIRSNGLLSGLLFLYDVAYSVPSILAGQLSRNQIRRLTVTCVAGALVALGFAVPQYVAYKEYCISAFSSGTRPWCHKTIPSIYTWVQSQYWNVGFLRYWTLPNLPLFFMAAPMLWLLLQSSLAYLRYLPLRHLNNTQVSTSTDNVGTKTVVSGLRNLPQLALPQLVLAITAFTSFHVQVVNRLSSGYPIWYLFVAEQIIMQTTNRGKRKRGNGCQLVVRGIIMYAMIQGALFASFLPPA